MLMDWVLYSHQIIINCMNNAYSNYQDLVIPQCIIKMMGVPNKCIKFYVYLNNNNKDKIFIVREMDKRNDVIVLCEIWYWKIGLNGYWGNGRI